jgi:peptidoglycan/xylan/chitin deacetylase (PgdA/CDA1 family)
MGRGFPALVAALLTASLVTGTATGVSGAPSTSPPAAAAAGGAGHCRSGHVSLTFDDGPLPSVTPGLVHTLQRLHVPATFFMVGERVAASPATARHVARSGFLVANHTRHHEMLTTLTDHQVRHTLRATQRALHRAGVVTTPLVRPPYGLTDARVQKIEAGLGLSEVLWTVDPQDWDGSSSATVAARILGQLEPGGANIVIQHDGLAPATVAAVPRVVHRARRRGYCFVALDEHGQPGFPTPRASLHVEGAREGRSAVATITLDRPTARTTSVRLRTHSRSATSGSDFTARDVRVAFPAGAMRARVAVPLLADRLDERDERFAVVLRRPRHLRIARAHGTALVRDDDRPPAVWARDATVTEPVLDPVTALVRLHLGRVSGRRVVLDVVDVPGTAEAGTDYESVDVRLVVPAGTQDAFVPVVVLPDQPDAPDTEAETLAIRITAALHARLGDRSATLTIVAPEAAARR